VDDIEDQRFENLMIVSPDIGGVVRARAVAKSLGVDLGIIDKRREKANHSEVMHIIGDVEGRTCILVDDMVDTAGTLCHAAKALKEHGAAKVSPTAHPVLSGRAIENIENSVLDELVVTNTIPLSAAAQACAVSVNWISHRLLPKRFAASAMKNRSARCSVKALPFEMSR
jgi:ribose-phosphate pyrophosphokinase